MHDALVLVVDDHAGFRRLARRVLEAGGFSVAEAETGAGALAAVEALSPALVLLDIQLPDVSGFEIARTLSGIAGAPTVVLTSTRDAADYGGRIEASSAVGFVPKAQLSASALRTLLAA
jgi:CheY-like chemotaxis protein